MSPEQFKAMMQFMSDSDDIFTNFEAIKGKQQRVLLQICVMNVIQIILLKIVTHDDPRIPWDFVRGTHQATMTGIGQEMLGLSQAELEEILKAARLVTTKFFDSRPSDPSSPKTS